jgi:SAM-dependent methyltransferase
MNMTISHKNLRERIRTRDLRVLDRGPLAYTLSNALHYGLRVVLGKQIKRDQGWVQDEYEVQNRTEHWRDGLSLDDLIYSDDVTRKWILKDKRLVLGTDRVVREHLLERLRTRVAELLPSGRGRVAEFGCGTGRNLFFLAKSFPDLELVGIELDERSTEYARTVAKREGFKNITFHAGDMTADTSRFGAADVVYSIHALEQLPRDFVKAIDNMIRVARKGLVLFEPVHELFPRNLRGLAARFRVRNADYLDGLLTYLRGKSEVEVRYAEAMRTVGNPLNHTTEIAAIITGSRGV